jgi:hypothetical protein
LFEELENYSVGNRGILVHNTSNVPKELVARVKAADNLPPWNAERIAARKEMGEYLAKKLLREPMFGQKGLKTSSKTVYNKGGVHIDIENPDPGGRPGQLHVQVGDEKIMYDPNTGTFPGASKSLRMILESDEVKSAIAKALKMLGESQ